MISLTIHAIVHLTGLPTSNQHISALITPQTPIKLDTDLRYGKVQHKIESLAPTDEERTLFYLLWLSQHFLCVPGFKICKEYLALATCIQEGIELAFAPFLLGTLYRGLFSLVDKEIDHNCGGPFWLFQA